MERDELTDEQWSMIGPMPPARNATGRPRADDRRTLNGILYVLRTGCAWMDMPRKYGSYATCWRRFSRWSEDGTWERMWPALLAELDAQQRIDWAQAFLDGSFVPAKRGGPGVGRTKVGKGTKLMLVVDGQDLPIGLHVDSAQPHELSLAETTLATIRVPRKGRGRPRTRPKELIAD